MIAILGHMCPAQSIVVHASIYGAGVIVLLLLHISRCVSFVPVHSLIHFPRLAD